MRNRPYIGWDIGGAHLKIAQLDDKGIVTSIEQYSTPLWQGIESLQQILSELKNQISVKDSIHAVTITAELVDYFSDRKQGVTTVIDTFSTIFNDKYVLIYAGSNGFIETTNVLEQYLQVASANWHATTQFIATKYDSGILIDIGSSTTDIIPFAQGVANNRGWTDQERLKYNELVYTGIVRTPVMAIVNTVPFAGEWQSVAAEQFATTADIYRLTGELIENNDMMPTADGAGKKLSDSYCRLARMLGTDAGQYDLSADWNGLARYIAEQQMHLISQALHRVISIAGFNGTAKLVGAGTGRFIAKKLAKRMHCDYVDFELSVETSLLDRVKVGDHAASVSVAQLARRHCEQ